MGKELGTYLRDMRKDAKITVTAMVKATGVSKSMITYIESGERDPGFVVMMKYATAVGVLDITPMLDIYLKEQAISAIAELEGTDAAKLIDAWLTKQVNSEVLSVDISKIVPLLDNIDKINSKLRKACGQGKRK